MRAAAAAALINSMCARHHFSQCRWWKDEWKEKQHPGCPPTLTLPHCSLKLKPLHDIISAHVHHLNRDEPVKQWLTG